MAQVLTSNNVRMDLSGNTVYCKALKTGFYAGGAATTDIATFGFVNAGTALTLQPGLHEGLTVIMDQASGSTVTLPSATGSGNYYDVLVGTTVTSNNHIFKTNGTDLMVGTIGVSSTATSVSFGLQGTNKTITMSPTTTGGLKGGAIHAVDIASGVWFVDGNLVASGTAATPVS